MQVIYYNDFGEFPEDFLDYYRCFFDGKDEYFYMFVNADIIAANLAFSDWKREKRQKAYEEEQEQLKKKRFYRNKHLIKYSRTYQKWQVIRPQYPNNIILEEFEAIEKALDYASSLTKP